ncbi:MAG: hypothetical protein V3S16_09270 [Candidatus Desulfatibia sp.]|uniref:hypothetical protein n=1 Tax=Candidatus Desulfatibia sp. TaxID=3101189 RepID=UPI002F3417EB
MKTYQYGSVIIEKLSLSKKVHAGLSPSIHKFGDVFIHSGLSAACDEPFGCELRVEWLSQAE